MARIRTIKPEFPQSETIGKLSRDARLLFIQLWTIADDSGRSRAASRMLASLLYPYDDDAPRLISKWLAELERMECIRRYEIDGSNYLEIANWLKHQKIDKPSVSKIPPFDEHSRIIARPREEATTDLGPRTLDLGPKESSSSHDDGFLSFWKSYPRKVGKKVAEKAFLRARREVTHERIMEALARQKPKWTDPQYIPFPATWLNQGRWDDGELLPPEPFKPPPGAPTDEELRKRYGQARDTKFSDEGVFRQGNGAHPEDGVWVCAQGRTT